MITLMAPRLPRATHLVADLELLRAHLGIDRWLLRGGSWGCTLALAYALRYPHRVSEIVLSAISTSRHREIDWLYGGVSRFFPEEHERFVACAGSANSAASNVVAAYDRLLGHPDRDVRVRAATAWARWEETVLSLEPSAGPTSFGGPVDDDLLALVRICAHYYANHAWLADGELIRDAGRLAGIPGVLVHGRLDLSCPVATAYELANAWPGAELFVCDESGHRSSPAKSECVRDALTRFADRR